MGKFLFAFCIVTRAGLALDPLSEAEDRRQPLADALVQAVTAESAQIRQRAALAYGRIQLPASVDPLLKLLSDSNSAVAEESVFALGQLGWKAAFTDGREPEIARALAAKLNNPDSELRRLVVEAIGKTGLLLAPQLLSPGLADIDHRVRAETLLALYRYRLVMRLRDPSATVPPLDDETMQKVLQLTNDPAEDVQRMLAYLFLRAPDARGAELALKLCNSAELWTRYYAITSLAKLSGDFSERAIQAALAALGEKEYFLRIAALQSLAALGSAARIPPQIAADPSATVRAQYAQALADDSSDAVLEKLQNLRTDARISVRAAALVSLAARMAKLPALVPVIYDAFRDSSWVIRQAAVTASLSLADEDKFNFLFSAINDTDVRVRATVIENFAGIPGPDAFRIITNALGSNELSERGTAVDSLGQRTEPETLAAAWSCYKNSGDEKWVELRESLVAYFASIDGNDSTSYLLQAAADTAPSVATAAIAILKSRGVANLPTPPEPQLSFSPYRELKFDRNPKLTLQTARGNIVIELYPQAAPIHVANIVGFVEAGKYDGLMVHRVVPNFVIQGGDPDQSGWGSAGYSLRAEINRVPFVRGALGMPRSDGFDTGGVQYFLNHVPTPHLDGQYTVFGQVVQGLDVVDDIELGDLVIKATITR